MTVCLLYACHSFGDSPQVAILWSKGMIDFVGYLCANEIYTRSTLHCCDSSVATKTHTPGPTKSICTISLGLQFTRQLFCFPRAFSFTSTDDWHRRHACARARQPGADLRLSEVDYSGAWASIFTYVTCYAYICKYIVLIVIVVVVVVVVVMCSKTTTTTGQVLKRTVIQ